MKDTEKQGFVSAAKVIAVVVVVLAIVYFLWPDSVHLAP